MLKNSKQLAEAKDLTQSKDVEDNLSNLFM